MIAAWWSWMTAMSLQIAVVVAVVAILERLLARRQPRLAAALWLAALAKLAIPPFVESPVSLVQIPASTSGDGRAWFWLWLAGVLVFGSLAVRRHRRLRRELLDGARPIRPGVLVSPRVNTPCVLGFLRPVALVPPGPVHEHALLHEFMHVRRRDPLMSLVALSIQVLYWFHPAAWLIRSRLATLREVGCDADAARSLGERAPEYRRMLLETARPRVLPAAGVSGLSCRLVERLEWLGRETPSVPRRILAGAAAALVLATCVPLARSAAPFAWPKLEETQGCLQRRFVILEAMSRQP
ncbi:MAG TPA: M56 family metallopeptidase [Planctomycetota bacterium]|nr:M56 family metallopeptidase [Planctomycetota bacterium]